MMGISGELLSVGDHVDFAGYRLTVRSVSVRRITEVEVVRIPSQEY